MGYHRIPFITYTTIITLFVVLLSVNGLDNGFSGLDSVAAVQGISVPENPDAAYYLKIHNAYRALVEHERIPGMPKPNYMPEMEWDVELEDAARSMAESCEETDWDFYGEVVGWSNDKNHEILHDSFNQISLFLTEPKPYFEKFAQFAQMITANARRLGCARHFCDQENSYFTVCKYWARYKGQVVMPYTGNFTTRYIPDLENDTRTRGRDSPEAPPRPGTPFPPSVMDSTYYLDIHNIYRDYLRNGTPPVAAKAFYMAKMEWDPILENAARRHAESCYVEDEFPLDDIQTIFTGFKIDDPNKQLLHRWFDLYMSGYFVPNMFFGDKIPTLVFAWSISRSLACWQTRCGPYEGYFSKHHNEPRFYTDVNILVCKYRPQYPLARFYPYIETRPVIPPKPTVAPTSPEEPDAEYYVKQHNFYRAKLRNGEVENQPAAKDMPDLKWDQGLAGIARDLSINCEFNRYFTNDRAGGNVAFVSETTTDVIHRWFRGHETYVYGNTTYKPTDASSAYTRMVWAKSLTVGCYRLFCSHLIKGDNVYHQKYLLTCVYSPVGNVNGELPYVKK